MAAATQAPLLHLQKGRRRVVVKGAIIDCPTCKGQGSKETELRLFDPIMEATF